MGYKYPSIYILPARRGVWWTELIFSLVLLFFPDLLPVLSGKKAENNTAHFLQDVFDILMDYIKKSNDRNNKIVDFHHPDQITEVMDFSLPDKPQNLDQILVDCKDALKYQVKTGKFA
jgi:glutamate decarboxylase